MPFQKGNPGRPKGSVNKATKAVREFLADLVDDPKIQRVVRKRVLEGETQSFFRALDKLIPDPPRELRIDAKMAWYVLPGDEDVADKNDAEA